MVTKVSNSMLANIGTGATDIPNNTYVASGMKNRLINGDMTMAQRGTNFPNIVSGGIYTLDRWTILQGGTAVTTVNQITGVPTTNEFQNSLSITINTADASLAANEYSMIQQNIEGYNVRDLIGRAFTISFWVYSPLAGTHCIALRNSDDGRSYIVEYTVLVANTWEKKSVAVPGGLITTGTWNWTNGKGLQVGWCLASGTSFQAPKDAWQVGNFIATANQVNCLSVTGGVFAITGTQLEPGYAATDFEHRPIALETTLCQRYFELLYIGGVVCYNQTTTVVLGTVTFSTTKRIAPTLSHFGVANFTNENGCSTITAISSDRMTNNHCMFLISGSGAVAGNPSRLLGANGATAPYFYFNAEL